MKDCYRETTIRKYEDGTASIISGCSIEEFNRGDGVIIKNIGVVEDGKINVMYIIMNGMVKNKTRFDIATSNDSARDLDGMNNFVRKTLSFLFGEKDFRKKGSVSFDDFERDYFEMRGINRDESDGGV